MTQEPKPLDPGRSAKDMFGAELRHWRELRGLSQSELAKGTHFTPDLLCKVEKADRWPTRELAEACDKALDTGGVLCRLLVLVEAEHERRAEARRQTTGDQSESDQPESDQPESERPESDRQAGRGPASTTVEPPLLPALRATAVVPRRGLPAHTGRRGTTGSSRRPGSGTRGGPQQRRPRPRWRWSGRPESLEDRVLMSAYTSADHEDHWSNVGPATLDQLRSDATALARAFPNAPRYELFGRAELLRERVFGLLDGRQRMSESRDLYFLGGAACGMLANVTVDFGMYDAALAHTRLALLCAKEAGHAGLTAWIRGMQSSVAYYAGRPRQAADYARRGQEHGATGTVAVWLPAQEARATGRLGERDLTRAALARAERARESARRDDLDEIGGILSFSAPKQHFYATDSCVSVGDVPSVVAAAEACVTGYREGPEEAHAYDNEASSLINLASAHVMAGEVEAAQEAIRPVWDLPPELRAESIHVRLRRLHRRLTAQRVRNSPVSVELRDQIETFLAADPTVLPPG